MIKLFAVNCYFSALILCKEAYHQRIGKRPLLAAEIGYILDLQADLFHSLTPHTILQGLTRLDKAGNQPVHPVLEMRSMGEQKLTIFQNCCNDGRRKLRVTNQPALRADPGPLRQRVCGFSSATAAEPVIAVPDQQLERFAGKMEQVFLQHFI